MPRPVGFTGEDEGAKKKWDAWKRELGLTKTEAKRRYIAFLIDTMRVYASGLVEARELLAELEYIWDQIKDVVEDVGPPQPSRPEYVAPRLPSVYLAGTVTNSQYRNNLQQIYSHSRRLMDLGSGYPVGIAGPRSVYSAADTMTGGGGGGVAAHPHLMEEFRNWQLEMNVVVNKLTREYLDRRRLSLEPVVDDELDPQVVMRRRVKEMGWTMVKYGLKVAKLFSMLVVVIMFLVWCLKGSVNVQRNIITATVNGKLEKQWVYKMVVLEKNKWFIRMLKFLNLFVGFV